MAEETENQETENQETENMKQKQLVIFQEKLEKI